MNFYQEDPSQHLHRGYFVGDMLTVGAGLVGLIAGIAAGFAGFTWWWLIGLAVTWTAAQVIMTVRRARSG
jgi:hypothetical protein